LCAYHTTGLFPGKKSLKKISLFAYLLKKS